MKQRLEPLQLNREQMQEWADAGMSLTEVAKLLKQPSSSGLNYYANKFGLKFYNPVRRDLELPPSAETLLECTLLGMESGEIAEKYHCSINAIRRAKNNAQKIRRAENERGTN